MPTLLGILSLLACAPAPGEDSTGLLFEHAVGAGCSGQYDDPLDEYAYIVDRAAGLVLPVNPRSCTSAPPIAVGPDPVSTAVTTSGRWIYVGDGTTHEVSVIRQSTNALELTLSLDFAPDALMLDASHTALWAANRASGQAVLIETEHHTVIGDATLTPGFELLSVTDTTPEFLLTVHDDGRVHVIDHALRAEVAQIALGGRPLAVHYATQQAKTYVCVDGDEPAIVVIPATGAGANLVSRRIPLPSPCASVRMDGYEQLGVAVLPEADLALVLDPATDSVIAEIPVGDGPDDIAFNGAVAAIGNLGSGDVSLLSFETLEEYARVAVGTPGADVDAGRRVQDALSTDFLYTVDPGADQLVVVDLRDGSTRLGVPLEGAAGPIAVAGPKGGKCH